LNLSKTEASQTTQICQLHSTRNRIPFKYQTTGERRISTKQSKRSTKCPNQPFYLSLFQFRVPLSYQKSQSNPQKLNFSSFQLIPKSPKHHRTENQLADQIKPINPNNLPKCHGKITVIFFYKKIKIKIFNEN